MSNVKIQKIWVSYETENGGAMMVFPSPLDPDLQSLLTKTITDIRATYTKIEKGAECTEMEKGK